MLIAFLLIKPVLADEYPEITNDVEIRYKWYKEIITGDYYPLKEITNEDKIDITKKKLGTYSQWNAANCNLSPYYYALESTTRYKYNKVENVQYVQIKNFKYADNVNIYYNNKPIKFQIMEQADDYIRIDLKKSYLSENLLFHIKNSTNYKISLYSLNDRNFKTEILAKEITSEEISVPDKTWFTKNTGYVIHYTEKSIETSDLTKLAATNIQCRYREKYVYKYEVKREYYDDNYYENINLDGYNKDNNDYQIFYKGEPITNIVEITTEKIKEVPRIEYIYVEKESNLYKDSINDNNIQENDSSQKQECSKEVEIQLVEKVIEKEKLKTPKKIYIIIIILIITITFLIIKNVKKYVE